MKNNKNWLIGGLLAAIVVMAVGYAALSQELEIFGTAQIDADWNVEIAEINEVTTDYAVTEAISSTETTATFVVDLQQPGASAVYDVVIENNGTINAIIDSIDFQQTTNMADITFALSGITENQELDVEGSHTATLTVEWDIAGEYVPDLTEEVTLTINYVQN